MEEVSKRHRLEKRDLQSRITQKKKSASKKTKKGVNDECVELERQLKERQALELAQIQGETTDLANTDTESEPVLPVDEQDTVPVDAAVESVAQELQSVSISDPGESGHVKKPNRQKARLARRAAEQEAAIKEAEEEAANLPDEREVEMQSMRASYTAKGLVERPIRSDGHCLYAAVADQLTSAGLNLKPVIHLQVDHVEKADYKFARYVAAAYIEQNAEDFAPFLEEPLATYVAKIRNTGEWGGHLEVLALSKAFGHDICILHGDGQVDKIESGSTTSHQSLWLAYYRHSHGLGEHYNSLRAKA